MAVRKTKPHFVCDVNRTILFIFALIFTKIKLVRHLLLRVPSPLRKFLKAVLGMNSVKNPRYSNLMASTQGLYKTLPPQRLKSFSILMPVYHPELPYLSAAIESCLNQSAPNFEVLVGFDGPHDQAVEDLVSSFQAKHPNGNRLKVFKYLNCQGGISNTLNRLADESKADYLVFVDHDDWIRPDLLFRYQQTVMLHDISRLPSLYCDEFKIDEAGGFVKDSVLEKPISPQFPYLFINYICHCLAVPREAFKEVGGFRPSFDGAQDYDLCLRLDVLGGSFVGVPFLMYAWRTHSKSTAKSALAKPKTTNVTVEAFREYVQCKGLPWRIEAGLLPNTVKAIPAIASRSVHVVMLFKDQKDMTLKCVAALKAQSYQTISITAVDNRSSDPSIRPELESLGVEVILADQPFNFSDLCNKGARGSRFSGLTDSILFLNNDVVLEADAIEEMVRWLDQPKVGIVGCYLVYPNGRIQHGGVTLDNRGRLDEMCWRHIDHHFRPEHATFSRVLNISDAVTGAALLIKRSLFEKIGGFDPVFYPIAFSDTDLCLRVRQEGLYCLYTPYAKGVHHEGASRSLFSIEDYEGSRWLFDQKYSGPPKGVGTHRSLSPRFVDIRQ